MDYGPGSALTSAHVLLECMAVEGICIETFQPSLPMHCNALLFVQVHECMIVGLQGEVKKLRQPLWYHVAQHLGR